MAFRTANAKYNVERERLSGCRKEGNGIVCVLGVIDSQVNKARAAVDRDIEEALAFFAIGGAQFGQMLDVDVDEPEVVVAELALSFGGLHDRLGRSSVKAFGLENTVYAIAVEVRQEMPNHEDKVVQRETCRPVHGADNGSLRLRHAPCQALWATGSVLTLLLSALAPFANRLVADPVTLCYNAGGFG